MRIFDFRGHCDGDIAQISARFQLDYGTTVSTLTYRFTGLRLSPSGIPDAAAISLLPLALKRHEELDVRGTLSAPVARKLELLQTHIADQAPFHGPIDIKATGFDPAKAARATDGSRAYCSFRGASAAALDDDHTFTHVLLVRGFDRALDDTLHWAYAKHRHDVAARHFGRTLITCETNLPRIAGAAPDDAFWRECLQSAAAAAITRLLGFVIGRIHVATPSTFEPTMSPKEAAARYASSQRLH
jgi:hypothetical protein